MKAEYTGETGHSAYTRIAEHEVDIYRGGNVRNAFVKHLAMHHPKEKKNPEASTQVRMYRNTLEMPRQAGCRGYLIHIFKSAAGIVLKGNKNLCNQP